MFPFHIDLPDLEFLLHDVMKISAMDVKGYSELDRDFTSAILDEAYKLARDELAPLNAIGDIQGCTLENGVVRTPEGFKAAFDALREGGWTGLDCDPEYGGQGLPYILASAVGLIHASANMALNMYPGLTHGAYSAIRANGSEAQKQTYLPKMVSCEWTGTMNLTEPHAGTDLGLIRTKAEPQDDGSYSVSGQKIFISAGEHDLSENIIHLVLARIPGGPEGVKGISLFIVPKFLVNDDGSLGERNNVAIGKLEEKMGIHGNSTCVMNFDGAKGFLIGEPHKGLKYMFIMMNEARLGVGLQGLSQAEAAYTQALGYAKDRLQGRAMPEPADPDAAADPLIVHPDIRRSLMYQKALIEGGRALILWASNFIDRHQIESDKEANQMASLLIPVIKSYLTDKGFESTVMAQQIFGGHGYVEETGVSQFVRDARITMIYEGANGIQALDLVGRKLPANGGAAMRQFFEIMKEECLAAKTNNNLAPFAENLKNASKALQGAVMQFVQQGVKNPNFALAGATDFLNLFALNALGLMWLRIAKTADEALENGEGNREFLEAKLITARYFFEKMLPEYTTHLARIEAGEESVMGLDAEVF